MKRGLLFVLAFIPVLPVFVALPLGQQSLFAAVITGEREARRHHQIAEARFRAGLFAEALAEYQAGYQVMPLPGFLINIAQCYRRLGDLRMASGTYRKFTVVAPDSPLTPQIKALIVEIDTRAVDFENARQNGNVPAGEWNDNADQVMPYAVFLNPPANESDDPAPALLTKTAPVTERQPSGASGTRWWLWSSIGAAVVGAAIVAIVLSTGGSTATQEGSLATLRR
ncbi:MAG TPA: tetratricopeptide repeat protein [Polyangia bacterium]|nr:tetratricopeptide repeat protein [Polyangia bacterium]